MKYHVFCVIGCTPTIKTFKTKKEVEDFLKDFAKKYGALDDKGDNWIDHVFYGKMLKIETAHTITG